MFKPLSFFCVAAAVATTFAASASAQSAADLERLEAATVRMSEGLEAFMVSRAPQLDGLFPDPAFDDEMRAAARCQLEVFGEAGGDELVEEYISALEVQSENEMTSLTSMVEGAPDILFGDLALQAMTECGLNEISQARAAESGLTEAMMNPEIIMLLVDM